MRGACGDPTCAARLAVFALIPWDPQVRPPCDACLAALTGVRA